MTSAIDRLRSRFRAFSATTAARAPLYRELSLAAASDDRVLALLDPADEEQRLPVLLFAAVHDLLLADHDRGAPPATAAALGRWYPTLAAFDRTPDGDAASDFLDFCHDRSADISATTATRSTQTNEVGRCASLLPVLGLLADEVGPLGVVDVGASGGLNLLLDHYDYRYEPGGDVHGRRNVGAARLRLDCGVRGAMPVLSAMPEIADRIGLDADPIDIADERDARWLRACVWPDQLDRFERLATAIEIGRGEPPTIVRGDAVRDLAATIDRITTGHPVVVNTWVLSYLTRADREAYVCELDRVGHDRDVSWLYAESPAQTTGLPSPPRSTGIASSDELTAVVLVRWRAGVRTVERLATAHPHGYWLHWER